MISLFTGLLSGLLFGLLVGLSYLLSQPRSLLNLIAHFKPGALYAVPLSADAPPTVALTLDDGPSAYTADILAVLARYDVRATFFNISDYLPGYEAVVAEAIAAGHELGNHLSADESSVRLSPAAFEADLLAAEKVWQSYARSSLRWLRPGMGWYSASMVAIAQRHGYRLALGSVFPYDTHVPFSGFAIAFILSTIQPGDIIVLHDGERKPSSRKGRGDRTVSTLKKVLPVLQARGYTVTTLTNLTEIAAQT